MVTSVTRFGVILALLMGPAWAQDGPGKSDPPNKEADASGKQAAADAGKSGDTERQPVVAGVKKAEEVKILKPQDLAAELLRLKSKADIKAEVAVLPLHGRTVLVKGVIRNGKLIERFAGRRFISLKNIDHSQSGVRLWWVNNTAGWIFLRYSQVQTIALVGQLTAEERRQIMEALKVKKGEEKPKKTDEGKEIEQELQKMSPSELEAYLLEHYPADKGWTHQKLRELKRRQIIENQMLAREDAIFVRYFHALIKARLKELKRSTKKVEFEPGSEEKKKPDASEPDDGDEGTGPDTDDG
ncbi:MAG: hypothetical protein ACYTEZ_02290 [Planctomycetota bacterium]|jgi:hypothetical protein